MLARRATGLAAVLIVTLMVIAATASADYSARILVSLKFPAFHGKVKADRGACAKHRKVKLFRQRPGADTLLGADRTNAKGKWSIPIGNPAPGAAYYAKAPAKGACRTAKSKVLRIG